MMSIGYVYILSNPAMPGLLKIGRTDRRPEARARELAASTGVPSEFCVEFSVLVADSMSAERFVHKTLEDKGYRNSKNREFFSVSLEEASEVIRQASVEIVSNPKFASHRGPFLSTQFDAIPLPGRYERISEIEAERLESQLLRVASEGYSYAYAALAHMFLENCPNSLKYRRYVLDHCDLEFATIKSDWSRNSMGERRKIGQYVANFLEDLFLKGWIGGHDFESVQRFLMSADGYTYEGFVDAVSRGEFPVVIRKRALEL